MIIAEDPTSSRLLMVEILAERGPIIAILAKVAGMAVTTIRGIILSVPP